MRIALFFFVTLLGLSCQSHSSQQAATESATNQPAKSASATSVSADTLCFQQILKRDTTTLRLMMTGATATGYLDIHPFQRDRARGRFGAIVAAIKSGPNGIVRAKALYRLIPST